MSYNGSGVFTINTAGQPVITGTTISSTTFNNLTADLATGLTTALTKDGQSTPTANIGMGAFKITNLAAGTVASDAARLDQVQGGSATFITAAGTDTITGTTSPALTAYATGNQFSFLVANTNTGAVTINVDGLGAKAITRTGTTALVAGDMVAGQAVEIIYDGTRFQLVNGNSFTNLKVSGTLGVTGVSTFTAQPIVSSLTASLPVFTDASKGLVSNTMTGTGNVVMSTSPTLVTPALGTPSALVGTNITGTAAAFNINGTVGATTPAAGTFTSLTDSGNLTFTGTGNRITGDFSNATFTNRVAFQTSTANSPTTVNAIPSGTGTVSQFIVHSAADPGNASRAGVNCSGTVATFFSDQTGTGTYLPMVFNTGGSERARIDSSGNVGIGTSLPSSKLTVGGNPPTSGAIAGVGASGGISLALSDNVNNSLYVKHISGGAVTIGTDTGGQLAFASNGFTEAMRIDASGNLLVGTTTSSGKFCVTANSSTVTPIFFNDTATAAGAQFLQYFQRNGVNVGSIQTSSTTTLYVAASDYRLKENVAPMSGALAKVQKLKPVNWNWKLDKSKGQGFIAHELQEVMPDCVTGEKDAVDADGKPQYQGIDTSFLVATLTAAIKELKAIVDAQAVRIAALEA